MTDRKKRPRRQRSEAEGESWIGASFNRPAPQNALEAAQRAKVVREHYLPFAEARAAEGRRWYAGIVEYYRRELAQLDAMIAAGAPQKRTRRQKAGAA